MNEEDRRVVDARAETTTGLLDAATRWAEIGELVASSNDDIEAKAASMALPFGYSDSVAWHILNMPFRRLTLSWRAEAEAELQELHALLEDKRNS